MKIRSSIPGSVLYRTLVCVVLCCIATAATFSQGPPNRGVRMDGQGRMMGSSSGPKMDSLEQRDVHEDSITIYYRYFDSSRVRFFDSTVGDFYKRFPLPAHYVNLGSLGQPAHSLLFNPYYQPGWDAGFHAFDIHRMTIEGTKLYQTTRPYSELDYIIGANQEQTISVLHTQNINPVWNAAFEFKLATTPGNLTNQNTSSSNLRFNTHFITKSRKYSGVLIALSNVNRASQNGGIQNDSFLTSANEAFDERQNVPVKLGANQASQRNPFQQDFSTALNYRQQIFFFRHQFDFGQKDSAINPKDSSVIRFFYPRFRLQHQVKFSTQYYHYLDENIAGRDSLYYNLFNLAPKFQPDSLKDKWREFTNEAALILFPVKDNQDQFFKAGAGLQLLKGMFDSVTVQKYSNLYLLGEYRNRTRNRKWDLIAAGKLYLGGLNAGDYKASASLERSLGKKAGSLLLGFENINRTPSFVFDSTSSFFVFGANDLKQENWTHFSGRYFLPSFNLSLAGHYYLITNYTYMNSYTEFMQDENVQSVLHLQGDIKLKLSKRFNLYTELHLQQATGNAINVPLVYTRNRLAFEGIFYKKLQLSTGLDIRYHTPYTADDFSPFNGLWVRQSRETISIRPELGAYLNFRVRSFWFYLRADNLNTIRFSPSFGFLENNFTAPAYINPGLFIRLGIHWSFVN